VAELAEARQAQLPAKPTEKWSPGFPLQFRLAASAFFSACQGLAPCLRKPLANAKKHLRPRLHFRYNPCPANRPGKRFFCGVSMKKGIASMPFFIQTYQTSKRLAFGFC
jgi:hypothetical protein